MTLKLYYDLLSQPSRAIYIFLKATNIAFESKPIALQHGVHLTDWYKQVSRFHLVPVIEHDGFNIMESIAILRYLVRTYPVADHWFPKNSRQQAKVDEYLEWQHHNTRFLSNFYLQRKGMMSELTGAPTKQEYIQQSEDRLIQCLEKIDSVWLHGHPFLAGDTISIADLLGACDLEQTKMAGFDPTDGFPNVRRWMAAVRDTLNPHYDEAHEIVYRVVEKHKVL